ncbi:MAG: cytochrome c3 family protein [Nitrospirota bacterium]|nr:cytochrome c3 family protein [Nitrospirota bacterium]
MRKVFLIAILFFIICDAMSTPLYARVKGKCRDCHNMHAAEPFPALTRGGCLGCHGREPDGDRNIITEGKVRTPQVLHHMIDGDLAGGNFYYVADGYNPDYSKGHNVAGISLQEPPPMNIPPGFLKGVTVPGGAGPTEWPQQQQLTCAGTWGCHGNRTIEDPYKSIKGAHHADDRIIEGETVGDSYRFLYGIKGKEHKDWEYQATIDNHNGYKGDISHSAMDTISYLCSECHGKFHAHPNLGGAGEVGYAYNSSPWIRHPTDVAFSSVLGGYTGSEYQNYISYSLEAPVAYIRPTGGEEVVNMESIVMCLSCHRAHASPYPDLLRWDYDKMVVERGVQGTGCLTCHSRKGR